MTLEKRIKAAMYEKGELGPPKPKTRERRVSEVVAKMSPAQRRAIYSEIVDQGFGDE